MEITKGENANLAGMEPRCPKCGSNELNIGEGIVECACWTCDWSGNASQFFRSPAPTPPNLYQIFKHKDGCTWLTELPTGVGTWGCSCGLDKLLLELEDYELTAPTPPLDVEGWKRPEDGLPDDGADILAAIWWADAANPEQSTYGIHDCAYYEGGEGSGQKIFTDCEGEEFEAKEVAFWIYKKDLAASLLRRHIASPAPRSCPKCGSPVCQPYKSTDDDLWTQRCNKCEWFEKWSGLASPAQPEKRPKIICLCGSTRFIEQFAIQTWELELKGHIVLGCTLLPSWYCPVRDHFAETLGVKDQRDNHHLQKIDLAEEVLVLNIGGYIGESTRNEIAYAEKTGKPVKYLEPLPAPPQSGKEGQ